MGNFDSVPVFEDFDFEFDVTRPRTMTFVDSRVGARTTSLPSIRSP